MCVCVFADAMCLGSLFSRVGDLALPLVQMAVLPPSPPPSPACWVDEEDLALFITRGNRLVSTERPSSTLAYIPLTLMTICDEQENALGPILSNEVFCLSRGCG